MDRRTKILTGGFGVMVAYAIIAMTVYPRWIAPLLSLDEVIAKRQKEYDELAETEDEVAEAKHEYARLTARVGSFDISKVETELRDRINKLIEKHHLLDAKVTPSRSTSDRKTHLEKMRLTVTVSGSLESAVQLLREVSELPQIVRVGNAALYPASSSGRARRLGRVNLRVPLEVLVLPQQRLIGTIEEKDLSQPTRYVRHKPRDYATIWEMEPFTEPQPLRAQAGRDLNLRAGKIMSLNGKVSGGDGEYMYSWSPSEGLSDSAALKTKIDTSVGFSREYTLTVTDGHGRTAEDTIKVTVKDRRIAGIKKPPEPVGPRPKPKAKRWTDRRQRQLSMTLMRTMDGEDVGEVMIYHGRTKKAEYFAVGDDFDGGKLVYVHPTGGLVLRDKDYFIYPIGDNLDEDIAVSDAAAVEYPQLETAAKHFRRRETAEPVGAKDTASDKNAGLTDAKPAATPGAKTSKVVPPSAPTGGGKAAAQRRSSPPGRTANNPAMQAFRDRRQAQQSKKPGAATARPRAAGAKKKEQEKRP